MIFNNIAHVYVFMLTFREKEQRCCITQQRPRFGRKKGGGGLRQMTQSVIFGKRFVNVTITLSQVLQKYLAILWRYFKASLGHTDLYFLHPLRHVGPHPYLHFVSYLWGTVHAYKHTDVRETRPFTQTSIVVCTGLHGIYCLQCCPRPLWTVSGLFDRQGFSWESRTVCHSSLKHCIPFDWGV